MDLYLDTENGNNANNGSSINTAFKTLDVALSSLDPGDRLLAIGTTEIADEEAGFAITTSDIVVQSYDYSNKFTIKPTSDYPTESNYGFIDLSADRIKVFGIRFEDLPGNTRRRAITADNHYYLSRSVNTGCKIANCEFYDIYDGYHGNYQEDITIIHNTFQMKNQGIHQNGIFVNNSNAFISRNNISYLNSYNRTFQVGGIRIGIQGSSCEISNNTIHDISCTLFGSGLEGDSGGIVVDAGSFRNVISNNNIYNLNYEIASEEYPLGAILIKGPNNKIFNNCIQDCIRAFSDFDVNTYLPFGNNIYKNNAYWHCEQVSHNGLTLDASNINVNTDMRKGTISRTSYILGKGYGQGYSTDIGVLSNDNHKRYFLI